MIGTGTIVAVASAPGRAPRAIVRVSGPETPAIIAELCAVSFKRGVRRVHITLDECSVPAIGLLYPAPRSYTGEDSAEILLTGSPFVIEKLIETFIARDGVRHAGPGEFSARAYLAGRITLEEAEGIASLIAASSAGEADAARRLLSGEAGDEARGWIDRLAGLLALVEAGIDFTDQEDVVAITAGNLRDALTDLRSAISQHVDGEVRETPPEGPLVVLAGAPNAGKTTLLNALLGRERGVVSATAGSTRDVLVEPMEVRGSIIRLADVAGLDASAAASDHGAQLQAERVLAEASVIVHCDPSGVFMQLPIETDARIIRLRTKCDLPGSAGSAELGVCAIDGYNLAALREAIADSAIGARDATPRRRRAMAGALRAIDETLETIAHDEADRSVASEELVASALREALDALGELAGNVTADEVIGRVFAGFCVGK